MKMKLWLLQINRPHEWDVVEGLAVKAETETKAREIASQYDKDDETWLNDATCTEVSFEEPGVVLVDFKAG